MAYNLMVGRLIVLLDAGKDNRGIVFQSNLSGYRGLEVPREPHQEGEPIPPVEYYDHIMFVKNMSETVTINGIDYQVMHYNAIVGVITN